MKTLDAGQATLVDRREAAPVDLVRLRTFSDRDAGTVASTFYFSHHYFLYDYGDTGVDVQVEPFLVKVETEFATMEHLPRADVGDGLLKRVTLVLRNGLRDDGDHLYEELRAENLEFSDLEYSQLFIDRGAGASFSDFSGFAGDEHTVRFRGDLIDVQEVTEEEIRLVFENRLPQIPWLIASDATKNDPADVGARLPIVYGQAKQVRCVGWDVGAVFTLAEEITDSQTAIEITDPLDRVPSSGSARIGEEEISWTGKTASQLTTVTRGASSTTAVAHGAGEIGIELIATAIWIASGLEAKTMQVLYVRSPFTGELVRVTTAFTATVADTTTISGATVCSVTLTAAQIRTLLDELQRQADYSLQASTNDVYQNARDTTINFSRTDHNVNSGSAASTDVTFIVPPGTLLSQRFVIYGTPPFKIHANNTLGAVLYEVAAGNPTGEYRFTSTSTLNAFGISTPAGGIINYFGRFANLDVPVLSLGRQQGSSASDDAVIDGNTGSGVATGEWAQFDVPGAGVWQRIYTWVDDGFEVRHDSAGGSREADVPVADYTGSPGWSEIDVSDATEDRWYVNPDSNVYEIEREVFVQGGGLTRTAEVNVGLGLQFFADVDGVPAPDGTNYTVGDTVLLENMADILRHLIAVVCSRGHTVIDADWDDAVDATHLDDNVHALLLDALGDSFLEIVATMAFESRANLMIDERAAGSRWRLLVAENDYEWPASVRTVDEFDSYKIRGKFAPRELYSRFGFLYAWSPALGSGGDAFTQVVRIDEDQNDVVKPSTANLEAAENRYGRRDHPGVALFTVQDLDTAEEIAGYYAWERIRVADTVELEGVPWHLAYDLERGDLIEVKAAWESVARKFRVIEHEKISPQEVSRLLLHEVV